MTNTVVVHPDLLGFDLRRPFNEWPDSVRGLITERLKESAPEQGSDANELTMWRAKFSTIAICARRIEELESALARARVATEKP